MLVAICALMFLVALQAGECWAIWWLMEQLWDKRGRLWATVAFVSCMPFVAASGYIGVNVFNQICKEFVHGTL